MRTLFVKIECDEKQCKKCQFIMMDSDNTPNCDLFSRELQETKKGIYRHPLCLEAEERGGEVQQKSEQKKSIARAAQIGVDVLNVLGFDGEAKRSEIIEYITRSK